LTTPRGEDVDLSEFEAEPARLKGRVCAVCSKLQPDQLAKVDAARRAGHGQARILRVVRHTWGYPAEVITSHMIEAHFKCSHHER